MNTMVINYENTVDLSRMNLNTDTWYFSTETVFVNIFYYFLKYHNVNLEVLIFHGYNKLTKYTFFDTVENISSGILIEIYLYTPVLIIFVHLSFAHKYIAGQFHYFTPHCHLSLHHFHQIGAFDFHRFILLPIFG